MTYDYIPHGTCSRKISVELDGETIRHVHFSGGCAGNTAGISRLVEGRNARQVMESLRGVTCGPRPTSCPDQLSKALEEALEKQNG